MERKKRCLCRNCYGMGVIIKHRILLKDKLIKCPSCKGKRVYFSTCGLSKPVSDKELKRLTKLSKKYIESWNRGEKPQLLFDHNKIDSILYDIRIK